MSGLPLSPRFSSKPPGSPSSTKKPPSSSPSSSSSSIPGHPEVQDVNPVVLIPDRIDEDSACGGEGGLFFIQGGGFVLAQDLYVLGGNNNDVVEENQPLGGGENLAVHGGGRVVFLQGGGFYLVQIDVPPEVEDSITIIYQTEIPAMNDQAVLENLDAVHHGGGGAFVFIEGGGFDFIDDQEEVAAVLGGGVPFDPPEVVVQIQNDDYQCENPIPNAAVNPPVQPQMINIIPDHDQAAAAAAAAQLQRRLQKKKAKRDKEEEQRIAKQCESDAVTEVEDYEFELFRLENPELFDQSSIPPSSEDDPVPATSCNMCPRSRFRSVKARRAHQKVHQGYSTECKKVNCGCIFRSDRIEESHRESRH